MKNKLTSFMSDGCKLDAEFFCPDSDNLDSSRPLIVIMSGFTGLKEIHPARFSRFLTARGHRCFSFDYRGFARSEGRKGHLILREQVRDVRNAIAHVTGSGLVSRSGIILVGWAMGAGVILEAACNEPQICGIAGLNGLYDGRRFLALHKNDSAMKNYESWVFNARIQATKTGEWPLANPFDIYPLDPLSETYVHDELRKFPNYSEESFSMVFADSLLTWKPEAIAPHMHVPLWLAHGTNNELHSPNETRSLASAYAGSVTEYWIEGAGHTEWMLDDNPTFQRTANELESWITQRLAE